MYVVTGYQNVGFKLLSSIFWDLKTSFDRTLFDFFINLQQNFKQIKKLICQMENKNILVLKKTH